MPESGVHVVAGVGPVGRAILDELVDRRLSVRAIVRSRVADLPDGVEVVEADLTDPDVTPRPWPGRRSSTTRRRRHTIDGLSSCPH
jgi:nucleoside-diphosphate-sugar epimerase